MWHSVTLFRARAAVAIGISCIAMALALLALPGVAVADPCPKWFPDLRCDRAERFEGFVAPMSAPYLFEDPFITTSVSLWGIWHDFPEKGVFQGGDARAVAAQVRVAITDRLALIATKDGLAKLSPDNDLLGTEKGHFNWEAGVKYALFQDADRRIIVTPSLRYQTTNGSRSLLTGNGNGIWTPAVSAAWGPGRLHLVSSAGVQIPVDQEEQGTLLFYHLHLDAGEWVASTVPFVELSGYRYLDSGDGSHPIKLDSGARLPLTTVEGVLGLAPVEGMDLFNLGAAGVDNNDVLTWAVGFRTQLRPDLSLGVSYERPLTTRREILKQRLSLNLLFEF